MTTNKQIAKEEAAAWREVARRWFGRRTEKTSQGLCWTVMNTVGDGVMQDRMLGRLPSVVSAVHYEERDSEYPAYLAAPGTERQARAYLALFLALDAEDKAASKMPS